MTDDRQSLIGKIRALLAKTIEAGCSEFEADAALSKARAMIDVYEISDAELELTKQEKAILASVKIDKYQTARFMSTAIAQFTNTECWKSGDKIKFCGLKPDTDFALSLVNSLVGFIEREIVSHLSVTPYSGAHEKRRIINGFTIGATGRITNRLRDLCRKPVATPANSNGRALVLVQAAAIKEYKAEHGIHLRSGRGSSRSYEHGSVEAGRAAGDRASFGRPIDGGARGVIGR